MISRYSQIASPMLALAMLTQTYTMFLPAGGNRASVLTVFENAPFLSVTCTSYVTSLGWGVGMLFDVHVNLRHMHIVRYVTGLGGADVNVHVNLHHMHIVRYVTGLGGCRCYRSC